MNWEGLAFFDWIVSYLKLSSFPITILAERDIQIQKSIDKKNMFPLCLYSHDH